MLSPEENYYGDEADGQWKPHSHMQAGGPPNASKLNTWANKRNKGGGNMFPGHPSHNFNGGSNTPPYKGGWQEGNRHTPSDKVPWSDPLQDQMLDSFCDDMFGMNLNGPGKMGIPPHGGNGAPQWGRGEINQTTPWDVDNSRNANFNPEGMPGTGPRFMQQMNMDNGTGQWRSWEHDGGFPKDFHHGQPGGFPPHMGGPGKMHGNFYNGAGNNFIMQQGFNDRMNHGAPFVPHQHPAPTYNKHGNNGRFQPPYPQAAPMNVMPPTMMNRPYIGPPSLASAHNLPPPQMHQIPPNMQTGPVGHQNHPSAGAGGNQFSVGTFSSATVGMVNIGTFQPNSSAAPPVNDEMGEMARYANSDLIWHDPNGDLRKWQRDTGTAAWGDPAKQSGQPIKRWQQVDENDPLGGQHSAGTNSASNSSAPQQSPDLLKKSADEEETTETGWGDLPPLNGAPLPQPQISAGPAGHYAQPQPLAAQNPNAPPPGSAWSDPQRSMPMNMPPSTHAGNFYGGQASSGTPTDWSRMSFSGSGFSGGNTPQIPGSFEGTQNGSVQQPSSNVPGQDASTGSTNEIADKLRMAASKGWIDPAVFCSNNKLSTHTASLLNQLINRLTLYEQNTQKIDQLKRQEASGTSSANGSPQRAELDRLVRETTQISNELAELRQNIHSSVEGQRSNKGMSLADELTNIGNIPIGDPIW
ncbi:M-domain domain-containing protein [Aphelenchoides bicaudatus]|nr:M-domain domain-containing protein [Aphelenchoides bicaudatus]